MCRPTKARPSIGSWSGGGVSSHVVSDIPEALDRGPVEMSGGVFSSEGLGGGLGSWRGQLSPSSHVSSTCHFEAKVTALEQVNEKLKKR